MSGPGQPAPPSGPRWRRSWSSLRGRATLAFAGLALGLTLLLVLGAWFTVTGYLRGQRESTTLAQAVRNAQQVQRSLEGEGVSRAQLLAQLPRSTGSRSLLLVEGEWFTSSLSLGSGEVPDVLREGVVAGTAARQRVELEGRTHLVVGVPLQAPGQAYFEVFPLSDLEDAYRILSVVLGLALVVVPLASLLLGWRLTRPVMRPLDVVSRAAAAIAAGDLDRRIDTGDDPHLAQLAASFNATADALQRRVVADQRFAADVAHELRTPLTALVGAAHVVASHRGALPAEGREGVDLLRTETERLRRLVEDLLEISRADSGTADAVPEALLLADLVRHSLSQEDLPHLRVSTPALTACVRGDRRRLHQVVVNLVDNAHRHGGGVTAVSVEVAGDDAGGPVRLLVDDAGPGIGPGERETVFERFVRGRTAQRSTGPGGGLGLSLVRRHVQACGGSVEVVESPWGGARFVVTLPRGEDRSDGAEPVHATDDTGDGWG